MFLDHSRIVWLIFCFLQLRSEIWRPPFLFLLIWVAFFCAKAVIFSEIFTNFRVVREFHDLGSVNWCRRLRFFVCWNFASGYSLDWELFAGISARFDFYLAQVSNSRILFPFLKLCEIILCSKCNLGWRHWFSGYLGGWIWFVFSTLLVFLNVVWCGE